MIRNRQKEEDNHHSFLNGSLYYKSNKKNILEDNSFRISGHE